MSDRDGAAEIEFLRTRVRELEEACRIARLHAPTIKLAPERRHTIAVLDRALSTKGENDG